MLLDSDIAVLGTGVAPLVAASHLLVQGKSVLVLNPDWDFFLEDSELPLDPLMIDARGAVPDLERLKRSSPEAALEQLRPEFPGAVEYWSGPGKAPGKANEGYRDLTAPFVRARARLWVAPAGSEPLDELYVTAEDGDLNPQLLEGMQLIRRFPGGAPGADLLRGVLLPRLCDVDVSRYRIGMLEFLRERLGPERLVCGASQIQPMPGGVRFHAGGSSNTAKLREGLLVFWTPRLTQWVIAQARRAEATPSSRPRGVRLWEQWSLISRDPVDPSVVGNFGDLAVWAEVEGMPSPAIVNRLSVLRAGPLREASETASAQGGESWASAASFNSIMSLMDSVLKWNRVTLRGMRPRAILEWEFTQPWFLSRNEGYVLVVPGSDGPLTDVVRAAREACAMALEVGE